MSMANLKLFTITLNTLRDKEKRSRGFCVDVWRVICRFIGAGRHISV